MESLPVVTEETVNIQAAPAVRREPSDTGLRIIIVYKAAKAIAWPLLAVCLFVGLRAGLEHELQAAIVRIQSHLSSGWSIDLSEWLLATLTRQHLLFAVGALALDGALSAVEAWALSRRKSWGEWLVVVATASLLPFEAVRLIHRLAIGRVLVLLINLAVVGYLAWRIRAEQRLKHPQPIGH